MSTTQERVMSLIKSLTDATPDLDDDLETEHDMDSLDMIELIMGTEEEFEITITDMQMNGIKTAGDLIRVVDQIAGQKAA